MSQRRAQGLMAAAVLTTSRIGPSWYKCTLEILFRDPVAGEASLQFLDSDRLDLPESGLFQRVEAAFRSDFPSNPPDCPLRNRAEEVFGGRLSHGVCEFLVAADAFRACDYLAINLGHDGVRTRDEVERGVDWRKSLDAVHLEFHKRALNRGRDGTKRLFFLVTFLVTRQRAAERITSLLKRHPILRPGNPIATEAVENLMFAIFAGGDNELLTGNWEAA